MEAFEFQGDWSGPLIATAVHAGHDLSAELAELMILDDDERFAEEDPFTDRIAARAPAHIVVHRSRFEMDLNRVRAKAVYRTPEDCWGMAVWETETLPEDARELALRGYDAFFEALGARLDEVAARGPFVLFDLHAYHDHRDRTDAHSDPDADINLGVDSIDHVTFGAVVGAFRQALLDQGFGVRDSTFPSQNLAWWVHDRYPGVGCVLTVEFKKLDDQAGVEVHVEALAEALEQTFAPVLAALGTVPRRPLPRRR